MSDYSDAGHAGWSHELENDIFVVACTGTFDYILHEGHKFFLDFCDAQSKNVFLICFVVGDHVVRENKKRHPFYRQRTRMKHLEQSGYVSLARKLLWSYTASLNQILEVNPDLYVFGNDQNTEWDKDLKKRLSTHNKKFIVQPNPKRFASTTELLKRDGKLERLQLEQEQSNEPTD